MQPPNHIISFTALVCFVALLAVVYHVLGFCKHSNSKAADADEENLEAALEDPEKPFLCHHCLTPHSRQAWFCGHCNTAVGQYVTCMPYLSIFPQAEIFRIGTTEKIRPSFLIITGYLLYSVAALLFLAPIYWIFLFRNLLRPETSAEPVAPPES